MLDDFWHKNIFNYFLHWIFDWGRRIVSSDNSYQIDSSPKMLIKRSWVLGRRERGAKRDRDCYIRIWGIRLISNICQLDYYNTRESINSELILFAAGVKIAGNLIGSNAIIFLQFHCQKSVLRQSAGLLALTASPSIVRLHILILHLHYLTLRLRIVFWDIVSHFSFWIVDQIHYVSPIIIDVVINGLSEKSFPL